MRGRRRRVSQFALACASHTPLLMDEGLAEPGVTDKVRAAFDTLSQFVQAFAPEQIIQFSPDHFHGFHYDVMPSFCVGAGARSYGDWGTADGPLNVDEDYALALLDAVRDADIDAAVSFDMIVDHGFVQIWEMMFGRFDTLPIVPIFVNAIGYPLPAYRRARLLGEAVGRFAAASGRRVLFAASGGLSHDPIVPIIRGAGPELRARLIGRGKISPEQQAAREKAVHAAGASAKVGEGPVRPLNPEWDHRFLDRLSTRDWPFFDEMTASEVDRVAGAGGNEVRAWIAAAAATAAAAGGYEVVQSDYLPIPGWIAGLALFGAVA
jgi:2,3-dihydroxyphenylpropionate 1,2-dioxygenase